MSTFTLPANKNVAYKYVVPFLRRIKFEVESERPTTTMVLDMAGLEAFRAGRHPKMYGGLTEQTQHKQELVLPFSGDWYLLIINYDRARATAVHYTVWS